MKKIIQIVSLGLLFVSPLMIGMRQGILSPMPNSAPAAEYGSAPAQRFDPVATAELQKHAQESLAPSSDTMIIIKQLLDRGADINAQNITGFTALMWAAKNNNVPIVELLLSRGADIETKDGFACNTVLMHAIEQNNIDMVRLFLNHGADIYAKNNNGDTAMKLAHKYNNRDIIGALQRRMEQQKP